MTEIRRRLEEADPVAHEPLPQEVDVQRMRRVVLAAAGCSGSTIEPWRRLAFAMAAVVVVAAASAGVVRWLEPRLHEAPVVPADFAASERQPAPRQMQFVAPGGTQVVWVFNPEFAE